MLEHLPAFLFAFSALIRALFHHLVRFVFVAGITTSFTCIGTGRTNQIAKRTLSSNDARCGLARRRTVGTGLQRREMVLLTFRQHLGAVTGTRIAQTPAVVAGFGTFHVMIVIVVRVHAGRRNCEDS